MGLMRNPASAAAMVVAAIVMSACSHPASQSSKVVNAVWNDADGFLLWTNGRPVDCSAGWPKSDTFIALSPKVRPTDEKMIRLSRSDLSLCASFGSVIAECESGHLDLSYDKAQNEYRGFYSFVMSNGTANQGAFRAELCGEAREGDHAQSDEVTDCRSGVEDQDESNIRRCTARLALPSLSNEDRATTLNIRGNAYDELKEYELAIVDYSEVIKLKPSFVAYAYANRALERCRLGDFTSALADYTEALKIDPNNAYARYGRGVALTHLGRTSEGVTEMATVNEEGPETAALYRELHMEPVGIDRE